MSVPIATSRFPNLPWPMSVLSDEFARALLPHEDVDQTLGDIGMIEGYPFNSLLGCLIQHEIYGYMRAHGYRQQWSSGTWQESIFFIVCFKTIAAWSFDPARCL